MKAVQAFTKAPEGESNKDIAGRVLQAGLSWTGSGWTTTRASKALFKCVGTAVVSSELSDYKKAFLFALALCWDYELGCLDLSELRGCVYPGPDAFRRVDRGCVG